MSTICPVEDKWHVLTPDKDIIFFHVTHVSPEGAKFLGQLLSTENKLEFLNP